VIIFIDMDGVLADFSKAALEVHGRENFWSDNPELRGPGAWGFDEVLYPGEPSRFWGPLSGMQFWVDLLPCEHADLIVKLAFQYGEPYVLTSPSKDPYCIPGKEIWLKMWHPELADRMVYTKHKHLLAGPRRILIDDNDNNCNGFVQAGGLSFTRPQKWNSYWEFENYPKEWLPELNRLLYEELEDEYEPQPGW